MKDKIDMGMNIPAVKGHCKIELFEDGEKVKEIEQDNYVHPKYLGALNKLYSYRAFEFDTNTTGSQLITGNTMANRGGAERVPFSGLLLTDAVHAEDPENERAVGGNIIGMSALNDNNSQQSPLKGRYNVSESEHTLEYHKFVYDFREDEANGVIGSVYTVPGVSNSYTNAMYTDKISVYGQYVSITGDDRTYYGLAHADDTYVYFCQRDRSVAGNGISSNPHNPNIYRVPKELIPQAGAIESEAIHMPVRPIRAITEKDGRLYMWGHLRHERDADVSDIPAGHTFVISAPKNDVTNYRVEKLWSIEELNQILDAVIGTGAANQGRYITRMGDMVYDEETDNFLIMYKDGSNTTGSNRAKETVYRFDNEFNLINALGGENLESNGNLYDAKTIVISNTIRNISDASLPEGPNIRSRALSTSSNIQSLKPYNEFFDMQSSSGVNPMIRFTPAAHFFSRVLLTQPINKTNQQTMKITYEFTREPLSLEHITRAKASAFLIFFLLFFLVNTTGIKKWNRFRNLMKKNTPRRVRAFLYVC